jgi:hypothetical protein
VRNERGKIFTIVTRSARLFGSTLQVDDSELLPAQCALSVIYCEEPTIQYSLSGCGSLNERKGYLQPDRKAILSGNAICSKAQA